MSSQKSARYAARSVAMHVLSSFALGLAIFGGANATPAPLVADGITYNLTAASLNASVEQFTLTISGINGSTDTEGNRFGFDGVAFTTPTNFLSATAVTQGFTFMSGGLNSGGCNGDGGFFCFSGFEGTSKSGPALPADSSLTFVFDVNLSAGDFTSWVPDLKIDWLGTKKNYDLVSTTIIPDPPVPAPEPSTLALLGGLLLALAGVRGLRRV